MFVHNLKQAGSIDALSDMFVGVFPGSDAELVARPALRIGPSCAHGYHSDAGALDCSADCQCPCHG